MLTWGQQDCAEAKEDHINLDFLDLIRSDCDDHVSLELLEVKLRGGSSKRHASDRDTNRATPKRQRRDTPDTYQRVTRANLERQNHAKPRATTATAVVYEEVEAPISEKELEAMHRNVHDINARSLVKKITPDKQRNKPPRRCDHLSVVDSIETTLGENETAQLEVLPRSPIVADDFRRRGGFDGTTTTTTPSEPSEADPRKTYLENDLLLDGTVMSAITNATEEDAEMIESVTRVPNRAEQLLPIAERATLQRAYCKSIIIRSDDEQDRRVAVAAQWIKRNVDSARHINQLMREALHTHQRSDGIRMHRVRYAPGCGRPQGEEIKSLPFHSSLFEPNSLAQKVMLPRRFEEAILLHAPIAQLQERACANGLMCQGNVIFLDHHFALREFVTPDEYQRFTAKGRWPHLGEPPRPCLLCMRHIINTAFHAALGAGKYMDNSSYPLGNISNYVDRPGEYASADCISNNLTHAGLVGHLVRHTLTKYSVKYRRVDLPDKSTADVLFVIQHGMTTLRTEVGRELHFRQGPP